MSCAFDLEHYRELLDAARAGGYRFAFFDREPVPGDLLLRHDVDLSLDAALTLAELEAEAGAHATYFPKASVRSRACVSSGTVSVSTPSTRGSSSTIASTPSWPGTTPIPSSWPSPSTAP